MMLTTSQEQNPRPSIRSFRSIASLYGQSELGLNDSFAINKPPLIVHLPPSLSTGDLISPNTFRWIHSGDMDTNLELNEPIKLITSLGQKLEFPQHIKETFTKVTRIKTMLDTGRDKTR